MHEGTKTNDYHLSTVYYLQQFYYKSRQRHFKSSDAGIKHATAHHQEGAIGHLRRQAVENSEISASCLDAVNSVGMNSADVAEADDVDKVNNGNNNANANDKTSAHNHEQFDGTDVENTGNV